jgi:hypothetical protein
MPTTTDPDDPRLEYGSDSKPRPQAEAYLVLSEEERAKGFVRPLRRAYKHVGLPAPKYPLIDLTDEEKKDFERYGYVKYEKYPESESPALGRYWTQSELDKINKGCGELTIMAPEIAATYAREPHFYGATYCMTCRMHLPVTEFVWLDDGSRVGS